MKNLRAYIVSAIMGALGFILMMLEISVPLMPSFIKLDFSELPALITSFAFGPLFGVLVCLIKNLIHLFISQTAGIGELSNFLLGASFAFVAGFVYKKNKTRNGALLASVTGSLIMGLFSILVNYFLVYPLYAKLLMPYEVILGLYKAILPNINSIFTALLVFNAPFTLVKGLIDAAICFLIYKKLSPILKKSKNNA